MSLFCCERAPAGIVDRHTPRNTNGQGGIRTHGTLAGTPVFETGRFNRSRTCPELPDAQTRSKYQDRARFATGGGPTAPSVRPARVETPYGRFGDRGPGRVIVLTATQLQALD